MNDIHKTVIREMANCDMNCNRVAKKFTGAGQALIIALARLNKKQDLIAGGFTILLNY